MMMKQLEWMAVEYKQKTSKNNNDDDTIASH